MAENSSKEVSASIRDFVACSGMGDGNDGMRRMAAWAAAEKSGRPFKECFKRIVELERKGHLTQPEVAKLAAGCVVYQ